MRTPTASRPTRSSNWLFQIAACRLGRVSQLQSQLQSGVLYSTLPSTGEKLLYVVSPVSTIESFSKMGAVVWDWGLKSVVFTAIDRDGGSVKFRWEITLPGRRRSTATKLP